MSRALARQSELRRVAHNTHVCGYRATIVTHRIDRDITIRREMAFLSRAHMVALITMWNAQQPERYVYWQTN